MQTLDGVMFLGKPTRVDADTNNGARNKPNEDRFTAFMGPGDKGQPVQFLVVADGVTSTHGGERASDIAVRVLQQLLQAPLQAAGRTAAKTLRDRLADAIHRANQEILETARKDPELKGMSTTLVVAAVDGDQLIVMNVGDSRAYLIRNGKAYQLTRDHTWVQEALEEGRITREQAATHPNKHVILRYLGDARGISIDQSILDPDKPAMDVDETEVGRQQSRPTDTTLTLRSGDALLLCSDGLYGRINEGEIAGAATRYAPSKAVKSMIDEAVKRDEPDNITIVLWTTADAAPVAAVAASKRPALLLAAAGVTLVLLAIVIFMQLGAAPEQAAAPTADEVVAVIPTEAITETATQAAEATVEVASEALPAEMATAIATESPTESLTATAMQTATPAPNEMVIPGASQTLTTPVQSEIGTAPAVTTAQPLDTPFPEDKASALAMEGATQMAATIDGTPAIATSTAAAPTSTKGPTSTPMVTATPRPTNTPTATPTRTQAPAAVTPAALLSPDASQAVPAGGPRTAQIIQPGDNHSSSVATLFKWVADAELAPGQEFEIIFWKANGESETQGRGLVRSSTASEILQPVNTLPPDAYEWALILVQPLTESTPYLRVRQLAGPYDFTVPGDTGDGGSGGDSGDTGGGNGGPRTAQIIQPGDNHSSSVATLFKWVADAELAPGQEFEIIFWKANGESETQGKGLVRSSTASEIVQPVDKLPPDTYKWALILVQPLTESTPYLRVRQLAGPYDFTVPGDTGGGDSGGDSGGGAERP